MPEIFIFSKKWGSWHRQTSRHGWGSTILSAARMEKYPRSTVELIAIAVGCTTQCPYCIEVHSKAAKAAGATREEIAESAFLAAALRAGGAATHGAMALKFFDGE
jgi:AhpD family alkylhydroperoxidase